jgi:hypothetical protein
MKIVKVIEYLAACLNAITKGFSVTAQNWPASSPFDDATKENNATGKNLE